MRSSGKHTEGHHLIRCLAPEEDYNVSSMERRLISLEERIDSMQSRFDVLTGRIGNIEQLLQRLATASEALRS
jgi:prefoldin subunit 5